MSDMGDDFADWDEIKRAKKISNKVWSTNYLKTCGIRFTSHNGGIHLIVESGEGLIDFWPSTGKFIIRTSGETGRGIKNLVKRIKR